MIIAFKAMSYFMFDYIRIAGSLYYYYAPVFIPVSMAAYVLVAILYLISDYYSCFYSVCFGLIFLTAAKSY